VIYLLDTNTLVYALNRQGGVRERVNDAALSSRLATSSIVVAELLYGAGRSMRACSKVCSSPGSSVPTG
jgi:predicted nucleic acid-binding protein